MPVVTPLEKIFLLPLSTLNVYKSSGIEKDSRNAPPPSMILLIGSDVRSYVGNTAAVSLRVQQPFLAWKSAFHTTPHQALVYVPLP